MSTPHLLPRLSLCLAGSILAGLAFASSARADFAILRNGRTIEVTDHRQEGSRIVLVMEGGGEIALPGEHVLGISPAPPSSPPATAGARPVPPPAEATPRFDGPVLEGPSRYDDGAIRALPGQVFDRAALREIAARVARRHQVDEALVHAVIQVESRYDAFAVSPRGAMGLMQLMPQTAARFAVRNAFDPVDNIEGGVRYLKELLGRYRGEKRLALAAYNAGEDAVDRFKGIPPFRETQQYVVKVLAAVAR